jgi:hypothetical protein
MDMANRGARIADELESLRENEAVECVGWNGFGCGEIGEDRCLRVACVDIQHIRTFDRSSEPLRVLGVKHLEHMTVYRVTLAFQKRLDVMAVQRSAAVTPPDVAEGPSSTKCSEDRRPPDPLQSVTQTYPALLRDRLQGPRKCGSRARYGRVLVD